MHVQNCEVITGSVLGAAITVPTAVRMRANRFTRRVARLCGTVALAGWAISGLTGFDSPRIEKPNLAPIEDQRAASLSAKTESVSAIPSLWMHRNWPQSKRPAPPARIW